MRTLIKQLSEVQKFNKGTFKFSCWVFSYDLVSLMDMFSTVQCHSNY